MNGLRKLSNCKNGSPPKNDIVKDFISDDSIFTTRLLIRDIVISFIDPATCFSMQYQQRQLHCKVGLIIR